MSNTSAAQANNEGCEKIIVGDRCFIAPYYITCSPEGSGCNLFTTTNCNNSEKLIVNNKKLINENKLKEVQKYPKPICNIKYQIKIEELNAKDCINDCNGCSNEYLKILFLLKDHNAELALFLILTNSKIPDYVLDYLINETQIYSVIHDIFPNYFENDYVEKNMSEVDDNIWSIKFILNKLQKSTIHAKALIKKYPFSIKWIIHHWDDLDVVAKIYIDYILSGGTVLELPPKLEEHKAIKWLKLGIMSFDTINNNVVDIVEFYNSDNIENFRVLRKTFVNGKLYHKTSTTGFPKNWEISKCIYKVIFKSPEQILLIDPWEYLQSKGLIIEITRKLLPFNNILNKFINSL